VSVTLGITFLFFILVEDRFIIDKAVRFWSVASREMWKVFVAAISDSVFRLVNFLSGMCFQKLRVETEVRALVFDDEGSFLLTGTKNGNDHRYPRRRTQAHWSSSSWCGLLGGVARAPPSYQRGLPSCICGLVRPINGRAVKAGSRWSNRFLRSMLVIILPVLGTVLPGWRHDPSHSEVLIAVCIQGRGRFRHWSHNLLWQYLERWKCVGPCASGISVGLDLILLT